MNIYSNNLNQGVTNKLGKAVGASGDVDKMAAALAKYKEVKAELSAPPAKKVKLIFQKILYFYSTIQTKSEPESTESAEVKTEATTEEAMEVDSSEKKKKKKKKVIILESENHDNNFFFQKKAEEDDREEETAEAEPAEEASTEDGGEKKKKKKKKRKLEEDAE